MRPIKRASAAVILGLAGLLVVQAGPADAACRNTHSFDRWLNDFRKDAASAGISRGTIRSALGRVSVDQKVIRRDRAKGVFAQSFLKFAGRMVSGGRLSRGRQLLKRHGSLFRKVQQRYGVPGPVITAFWGLETDFGAFMGDFSTIRSLATLAYDCRRPEKFRAQLLDALRLVDRGELRLSEMTGAWAGEIGQTQFLPSDYLESAVDFDGDGRRDLRSSVPDVIASTANLITTKFGWRAGEPWLEEVIVPARLPWEQADIAIKHPRSQWAAWGVKRRNGKPLPRDGAPASLVLPMGHKGPAFLAYRNFDVYLQWNHSFVYTTTAAYFATRLAGAPRVRTGNGEVVHLGLNEMKQLQRILQRRGYDVGDIDGILGAGTRAAVKDVQLKLGFPADSYPTHALLNRLR